MRTQLATACLGACLAGMLATSAEARLDHGPVVSHYDQGSASSRAKATRVENFKAKTGKRSARKATGKRHARTSKRSKVGSSSLKGRAVTAAYSGGGGGGGASRGCLQPAAKALLARIESQFGPVQVISTCRPGATIRNTGKPSKHRYGLAVDFNAGARKGAIVQWLIANHHSGGTMTYAGMSHVHVDIGQRFVSLGFGGGRRKMARS